jgi:hypothetical protein
MLLHKISAGHCLMFRFSDLGSVKFKKEIPVQRPLQVPVNLHKTTVH